MTKPPLPEARVEERLRHTLHAVAVTVTADSHPVPATGPDMGRPGRSRHSRRRRLGLTLGVAAIPLTMAAAAFVHTGPEYVDTIPPETIITQGTVDGDRYLLVETRRTEHGCDQPAKGVELVEEDENLLGSEWNTVGEQYGEPAGTCGADTAEYLANPALYNDGGTVVGDSFVWLWAVHPDVTAVRIIAPDLTQDLPVYPVDGAGYALFEIPKDLTTYTSELLIDGKVVPGSVEAHTVPVPR